MGIIIINKPPDTAIRYGVPMLKTFTFTCMHFVIAFSVAYALTGSIAVGGLVALVEPLCNSVGFYFHEKVWRYFTSKGQEQRSETDTATAQ